MKKNILFSFFLFFSFASFLSGMEEQEPKGSINIFERLPSEMVISVFDKIRKGKKEKIHIKAGFCYMVTQHHLKRFRSHVVALDRIAQGCPLGFWVPSTNLNGCNIVLHEHVRLSYNFFGVQCWYEPGRYGRQLRIDNDVKRNRYLDLHGRQTIDKQFDGPNDDGVLIVGGNIDKEYYHKMSYPKLGEPMNLLRDWFKELSENEAYAVYIGRFSKKGKNLYETKTNDAKDEASEHSINQKGTLCALALCKTMNRFAVVDSNVVKIFAIKRESEKTECPDLGTCESLSNIKKIAFIIPNTLLGVTTDGELYTFALDKKTGEIKKLRQTIKNEKQEVVLIKNFAVDACHPYHILLHTQENSIVLWNLDNHFPIGKLTTMLRDKDIRELWFYDDVFCLADDKNVISRYVVDFFVLNKVDTEQH